MQVRLGWTVVPKELKFACGAPVAKDWGRVMGTLFNGAANVAQAGAVAALSNMEETRALGGRACSSPAVYSRRRVDWDWSL
jgi:aspartate/methionine/tyrosine aminotransferase